MSHRPELNLLFPNHQINESGFGEEMAMYQAEPRPEAVIESRLVATVPTLASDSQERGWQQREAMLNTALGQLGPDSRLMVSMLNHDGEARLSQASLRVGVTCKSDSAIGANLEARRQLTETLPFLGRQLGYRFSQEQARSGFGSMDCLNLFEPSGVLLTSRTLTGVASERNSRLPLLLPRPGRYHPLRSAWSLLGRSQQPVTLEVKLQQIHLSNESLADLEHGLNLLKRAKGGMFELPGHRLLTPGEADVLHNDLLAWIGQWLRFPRGVRLSARLLSAAPLPDALILALGASLYPGRHILLKEDSPSLPHALDLRQCYNESIHLPELLPGPEELSEAGIPCYPAPRVRLAQQGTLLGAAAGQGVRLDSHARLRHVFVLGATGSGKSTLLLNMMRQDIAAGEGLCLIDPNGDLYEDVLRHVPPARAADVIQLDAGDFDRAFGLNFLETGGRHPEIMASQNANALLRIIDRLYNLNRTGGPMFELYMRSALLLAMRNRLPGLTLVEVARLFEDAPFRAYLLDHCTDAETVRFWKEVAERASGESKLSNMTPYVMSKLNQMTHNDLIKPIIGQSRSTIVFREAMDKGQILLVNLSKGRLGDMDSCFLGMMLLSKLAVAALGRADAAREARRTFHVYVDEYHNFAGEENLSLLLAEGRKYGIALTLATQHLRQLNRGHGATEALSAVLGNAATHVYFRTGPMDAETLAPFLRPDIPEREMPYLPDFTAVARIMTQGRPLSPFVMHTARAPQPEWHVGASRLASTRMQEQYLRYSRPKKEIREEMYERGRMLGPSQLAALRQAKNNRRLVTA